MRRVKKENFMFIVEAFCTLDNVKEWGALVTFLSVSCFTSKVERKKIEKQAQHWPALYNTIQQFSKFSCSF